MVNKERNLPAYVQANFSQVVKKITIKPTEQILQVPYNIHIIQVYVFSFKDLIQWKTVNAEEVGLSSKLFPPNQLSVFILNGNLLFSTHTTQMFQMSTFSTINSKYFMRMTSKTSLNKKLLPVGVKIGGNWKYPPSKYLVQQRYSSR